MVIGDLADLDDVRAAADGAHAAYFVYPIKPGLLQATTVFAQGAHEAGLRNVVNMSQISARREAASHAAHAHWLAERVLDWSPLNVTHLRPTFFAEWFILFGKFTANEGLLDFPFADGRHAPVSAEDQGHVIAAILENPAAHAGQTYPLFGAAEMDHYQIAKAISRALGRPVRYEPADIDTWIETLRASGGSPHLAQHLSKVAVDYRNGVFSGTNDIVETVGGRKPMTVEEFISNNIDAFTP